MGIATGAYRIWQQHTIQPAVDDSIPRAKGNAASVFYKVGQSMLRFYIDRLGIRSSVAERLHY
tara:strand:+ start:689 stop:877 length:189 start_codon:yes stop_codon:yes gene_type:complete